MPYPAGRRGPAGRAELILRLVLEVIAGRRPPTQLHGMVTRRVLRYVAAEAGRHVGSEAGRHVAARTGRPAGYERIPPRQAGVAAAGNSPGLRSMRICHPVEGVAEVSAVWRHRNRVRALAARFELVTQRTDTEPRWRCTELRVG